MSEERWGAPRELPDFSGESLGAVGRAQRTRSSNGEEVWALPGEDEGLARRLVALGESGVGGFVSGGAGNGRAWVLRRAATITLEGLARGEAKAWRDAIAIVRDVARALDACERAGLFPGPLAPRQIALGDVRAAEPVRAWWTADAFVRALVGGAGAEVAASSPLPKWTPPEQARGAHWDNAANRYTLGLVAYRLIAGDLPFGGAGLRHALDAQAGAPPPFAEAIASALRPGVQSFVLRLIDPSADARPRDAASIVRRCDELLGDATRLPSVDAPRRDVPRRAPANVTSARSSTPATPPRRAARSGLANGRARALMLLPLAAGALVAAAVLASAGTRASPPAPPPIRPLEALLGTRAADCAPCHARQVAEWQRSVMAHAAKSPLFGALESLVEEQVGRDARCPNGAGILRAASGDVCRADDTSGGLRGQGVTVTGAGGEGWCINCHAPGENLRASVPAWSALGARDRRAPLRDLLSSAALEGISCAACHETVGPVGAHASRARGYEGNPTWTSTTTGATFAMRPEDAEGRAGIANSGYRLDPSIFLGASASARAGEPPVHLRAPSSTSHYLASSEFCGACHDVRLFGTDAIGAQRGEHFKRLRNAYSEWRAWADGEARQGRQAATCQGCHMSLYPGVCVADPTPAARPKGSACPVGTRFEPHPAGDYPRARVASASGEASRAVQHYFTSVDIPLTDSFPDAFADDATLDEVGLPVGLRGRRDLLLEHTFRFTIEGAKRAGGQLEIPVVVENTGAGHRVPAGFSQEREIWIEMSVKDARGATVYEVGKIATDDADLRDKIFLRVTTSALAEDARGRPLGLFGADIADGPDVPAWSPNPARGGTRFRGRGLVNLQNGFLRCVRCIGVIDDTGRCQPGPSQGRTRADRFEDGAYDQDTGECRSNLQGGNEFFETYFPVGALDADRGIAKAPDAIIDTRSAPPGVPLTYTYALETGGHAGPFSVEARLRFRSFPPFLVRAFTSYEARRAAEGARPSGAQVTPRMLRRIEVVDVGRASARVE